MFKDVAAAVARDDAKGMLFFPKHEFDVLLPLYITFYSYLCDCN